MPGNTGIYRVIEDKVCPTDSCGTDVKASGLQTLTRGQYKEAQQALLLTVRLGARTTFKVWRPRSPRRSASNSEGESPPGAQRKPTDRHGAADRIRAPSDAHVLFPGTIWYLGIGR